MIVSQIIGNTYRVQRICGNTGTVTVSGSRIAFIRNHDVWMLRIPYPLTSDGSRQITEDSERRITSRIDDTDCLMRIMIHDEGWNVFRRYRSKDSILIGNTENSDIVLNSPSEYQCMISFREMTIVSDHAVSLNGTLIEQGSFHDGDLLVSDSFRMVLHHDFIVLSGFGIRGCSLQKFTCLTTEENRLVSPRSLKRIADCRIIPECRFCMNVEPYRESEVSDEIPAVLTVGPSLMMSFAAASTAGINGYLSYERGRTWIEILPMLLMPAMMVLSACLWLPLQHVFRRRKRKKKNQENRRKYDEYRQRCMQKAVSYFEAYERICDELIPAPLQLSEIILTGMRISVPGCDDILMRFGSVTSESLIEFRRNGTSVNDPGDDMTERITVPCILNMHKYHRVYVRGTQDLAVYLILSFCSRYGSDHYIMGVIADQAVHNENRWLRDLPHVFLNMGMRCLCTEEDGSDSFIASFREDPRRKILFYLNEPKELPAELTAIVISQKEQTLSYDAVIHDGSLDDYIRHIRTEFSFDLPAFFDAESAVLRFRNDSQTDQTGKMKPAETPTTASAILEQWSVNTPDVSLSCVIGTDREGNAVSLDLHESADGPHGLIAGATGSGKSELILSLILGLAARYSPDDLKFILIDFKGGSLAGEVCQNGRVLPHIGYTVSDLDYDGMKRILAQTAYECSRRETLLKQMSAFCGRNISTVSDYRQVWQKQCGMPYLSELVIIADEFAELKKANPEYLNELVSVARIGRSLGIHLILSTQKPGGIVTDQIWSNCSFKICMRVSERQDSMDLLHTPDAVSLKRPGDMIVLSSSGMKQCSGIYMKRPENGHGYVRIHDRRYRVIADSSLIGTGKSTAADSLIDRIVRCGEKMHSMIWTQPLDTVSETDLPDDGICCGIIDDYEHNSYSVLDLEKYGKILILCSGEQEKRVFLRMYLRRIRNADRYSILSVYEDTELFNNCQNMKIPVTAGSEQAEKLTGDSILIVTDLNRIVSAEYGRSAVLQTLSRTCVQTVYFLSAVNGLQSSLLQDAELKIVLMPADENEARWFLGEKIPKCSRKKHHGYIRDGRILEFVYPGGEDEQ